MYKALHNLRRDSIVSNCLLEHEVLTAGLLSTHTYRFCELATTTNPTTQPRDFQYLLKLLKLAK